MAAKHAVDLAARLAYVSRQLLAFTVLEPHNRIGVTLGLGRTETEVSVHGCEPDQLDAVRAFWPEHEASIDRDGILRCVAVKFAAFSVDWYRR